MPAIPRLSHLVKVGDIMPDRYPGLEISVQTNTSSDVQDLMLAAKTSSEHLAAFKEGKILTDWNVTDEDGVPIVCEPTNYGLLPQEVWGVLYGELIKEQIRIRESLPLKAKATAKEKE